MQGYCTDVPITSDTVTQTKGMCSGDTNSVLPDLSVCTIEKTVTLVNALLTGRRRISGVWWWMSHTCWMTVSVS